MRAIQIQPQSRLRDVRNCVYRASQAGRAIAFEGVGDSTFRVVLEVLYAVLKTDRARVGLATLDPAGVCERSRSLAGTRAHAARNEPRRDGRWRFVVWPAPVTVGADGVLRIDYTSSTLFVAELGRV